jgi:hypothetical protein
MCSAWRKNSLVPMGLSLTNKAIDFAFAMLYVRLLGPVGTGQYYFVVAIYGFFEIISRYGLGTLLTRDVAPTRTSPAAISPTCWRVRTLLWLICLPLMALVVLGYRHLRGACRARRGEHRRRRRCRRWPAGRWRCSLPTTPTPSAACSTPSRRWSIPPG